jgi:signal transduction histidine kinase
LPDTDRTAGSGGYPDDGGRPTPRAGWGRGQRRPLWWPANEPWPPSAPAWRRRQGAFFWRAAALLGLLLLLTIGLCTLAFWLSVLGMERGDAPGLAGRFGGGPYPFWRLGGLVLPGLGVAGLVFALLALRRVSVPVGGWLEAATRVEAGNYATRVPEQGPRELRRLARAFNAMTARLEADDAQRRRLLADVTHELRTPLTVIQGQLEGILDGVYPADAAHIAPVMDETRVLSRLIDDLRTLSLAESGALKLNREPTDLGVLAGETVAAFRRQAETAGVRLEVRVDDLPLVEVDPVRIREVLSNLLANALRYTPAGGTVAVQGSADARAITLAVSDTGAGIAPEALPSIFDRFYRTGDSRGTGLGLAIAKNLVEAHGGAISATSALGKGTTVRFRLPRAEGESAFD